MNGMQSEDLNRNIEIFFFLKSSSCEFLKNNEISKKGIWNITHNICCLVATRRGMSLLYCSSKENVHTRDQDGFWGSGETLSFPRGMEPAVGHKVYKITHLTSAPQHQVMRSQSSAP